MTTLMHDGRSIHYELEGSADKATFVLVNGLTQYSSLWRPYRDRLRELGFRVVTFDLLGQGSSTKPGLFIGQGEHVEVLRSLIGELGESPTFLAGVSFGGLVALQYAVEHGETLAGLVPISTFSELSPQLLLLGTALRNALIVGGVGYLQDLLMPMNMSDAWLQPRLDDLWSVKKPGWVANDAFALQNLMDSFMEFEPLTPRLSNIRVPTMILNGEFDFLTPRHLHETLRLNIPDSALVLVPFGYHAFTVEMPDLTAHLLADFASRVLGGNWEGGGSVWVASSSPGGPLERFPSGYSHLRSIPVRQGADAPRRGAANG